METTIIRTAEGNRLLSLLSEAKRKTHGFKKYFIELLPEPVNEPPRMVTAAGSVQKLFIVIKPLQRL